MSRTLSTEPLSSTEASLCRKEAGRKKKREYGARWEGGIERREASFHRSVIAYFGIPNTVTGQQGNKERVTENKVSRIPSNGQIPYPVKKFCVFPNLPLHFGQILDAENSLPDPVRNVTCCKEETNGLFES